MSASQFEGFNGCSQIIRQSKELARTPLSVCVCGPVIFPPWEDASSIRNERLVIYYLFGQETQDHPLSPCDLLALTHSSSGAKCDGAQLYHSDHEQWCRTLEGELPVYEKDNDPKRQSGSTDLSVVSHAITRQQILRMHLYPCFSHVQAPFWVDGFTRMPEAADDKDAIEVWSGGPHSSTGRKCWLNLVSTFPGLASRLRVVDKESVSLSWHAGQHCPGVPIL